jgi:hypothetical protein
MGAWFSCVGDTKQRRTQEIAMRLLLHLHDMLPLILYLGFTFVAVWGVKALLGVTFGGMFLTMAGYVGYVLHPDTRDRSSANLEAGPVKVRWDGAAQAAVLVAGVLMLVMGLCAFLYLHQVI